MTFFIVPMFLLFVYLPNYNFITIFINIVIIIFFSIGLILTTHIIIDKIKEQLEMISLTRM
ncbi:Uncharacterised protein [Staphylococcus aureus]|nr:Uncharacterised protein [Staphylococcus aureus]